MKNISSNLQNHLAQEVTTTATCIKITLKNNAVKAFTYFDENIIFEGVEYISLNLQNIKILQDNLQADSNKNQQITLAIDSSEITEDDINKNLYDGAKIEVFIINYKDVTQGKVITRTGYIGQINKTGGLFSASFIDKTDKLNTAIGSFYSPKCRAKFSDDKCKVNKLGYQYSAVVSQVLASNKIIANSLTQAGGYFNNGVVEFTSGNNAGLVYEVEIFDNKILQFVTSLKFSAEIGDAFIITKGCDKNFQTCLGTFNNAINFRAEPHLPGSDILYKSA